MNFHFTQTSMPFKNILTTEIVSYNNNFSHNVFLKVVFIINFLQNHVILKAVSSGNLDLTRPINFSNINVSFRNTAWARCTHFIYDRGAILAKSGLTGYAAAAPTAQASERSTPSHARSRMPIFKFPNENNRSAHLQISERATYFFLPSTLS